MSRENQIESKKILTLILPVFNEGDSVIPVIATLFLTVRYPFQILVIYDSPDDITVKTVKKLQPLYPDLLLVQNSGKKGVLNAIKTGLIFADTPYVGIWLAYHLDPFGIINSMVEKLDAGYDLVSANRFTVEGKRARGNYIKKLFSSAGNIVLNRIIGMPISDVTTSIKIYRKSLLDNIKIETVVDGGWSVSSELAIKAAINGYRLAEIPLERKNINLIHGLSNFKVLRQLPTYFRWLFMGWKNRNIIKSYFDNRQ